MDLIYRYDPFQPIVLERPSDADAAIKALLVGNTRLVNSIHQMQNAALSGEGVGSQTIIPVDLFSLGLPFWPGAERDQAPFALVLGCSDARVPIESIFDQGFNDLFVIRIAGNVLGTECLGSFDYATRHLGDSLKAVVVLGHTHCGAVSAAVDTYLSPNDYADIAFTHALRSLVDRLMVAVRGAANTFERRAGASFQRHPGYRDALVEAAVYLNSAIAAFDLQREVVVMGRPSLQVYYGACDIKSMVVRAEPTQELTGEPQLCKAPQNLDEFLALTDHIVASILTREHLA